MESYQQSVFVDSSHLEPSVRGVSPESSSFKHSFTVSPGMASQIEVSRKRKSFVKAAAKLPKIFKSDSESGLSAGSQPPPPDSQGSNYSNNSDIVREKKLVNLNKLMSLLKEIDPTRCPNISTPFDLTVRERTLREYATIIGQIWTEIL